VDRTTVLNVGERHRFSVVFAFSHTRISIAARMKRFGDLGNRSVRLDARASIDVRNIDGLIARALSSLPITTAAKIPTPTSIQRDRDEF